MRTRQQAARVDADGVTMATASDLVSECLISVPCYRPEAGLCFLWKSQPGKERAVLQWNSRQIFTAGQYEAVWRTDAAAPVYPSGIGADQSRWCVKAVHARHLRRMIPLEMEYLPEDIRVRNHLS